MHEYMGGRGGGGNTFRKEMEKKERRKEKKKGKKALYRPVSRLKFQRSVFGSSHNLIGWALLKLRLGERNYSSTINLVKYVQSASQPIQF